MVAEAYDPKEVTLFDGGPEVGQAFSALPFDHIVEKSGVSKGATSQGLKFLQKIGAARTVSLQPGGSPRTAVRDAAGRHPTSRS